MFEAFADYYTKYYPQEDLNYEEFSDVYSGVLNDTASCF